MAWLNAPTDNIARSKLAEEALARYPISLASDCRRLNGFYLPIAQFGDSFYIVAAGWAAGGIYLRGTTTASPGAAVTETEYLSFEFALPPEYVAGEDVKLIVHARYVVEAGNAPTTCTLDAQVYELTDEGVVGGDLITLAAQPVAAAWADVPAAGFVVTDAGLTPGDKIRVLLQGITTVAAGDTDNSHMEIGSIELLLDVKG